MNSPDGYNALMGFAKAVNRREQEKKLFTNGLEEVCIHGSPAGAACPECQVGPVGMQRDFPQGKNVVGAWAPPETTTARLKRLLFQLQNTQRSIAEAQAEIERVMASL